LRAGLCMKQIIYLFLAALITIGCSKTNKIEFCEGVTPEGEGVRCGSKFEDGDLTAVITSEDPFGVKTIAVQIFESGKKTPEKIGSINVDVNPAKQVAMVNLSLYSGGKYIIRAMKNENIIGEGELQIVEK
jgi:hypothetical protein